MIHVQDNCITGIIHHAKCCISTHQLNDASVPLHEDITIRIKPDKEIPDRLKNKIIISGTIHEATVFEKLNGRVNGFRQSLVTLEFSRHLLIHTTENKNIRVKGIHLISDLKTSIVIEARDNFGPVKNFRAEIDGQWIRFTNDKGSPTFMTLMNDVLMVCIN